MWRLSICIYLYIFLVIIVDNILIKIIILNWLYFTILHECEMLRFFVKTCVAQFYSNWNGYIELNRSNTIFFLADGNARDDLFELPEVQPDHNKQVC